MRAAHVSSRSARRIVTTVSTLALAGSIVVGCASGGGQAGTNPAGSPTSGTTTGSATPGRTLASADVAGLLTVRAEDKAGEDAYRMFANRYGRPVFANLAASQVSQAQTITMMMSRFGVSDPTSGAPAGSFTDPTAQRMYDTMMAAGSASADQALKAMAAFEREHAADLQRLQSQTSQPDLRQMYATMMRASASHLDACNQAMDDMMGLHDS